MSIEKLFPCLRIILFPHEKYVTVVLTYKKNSLTQSVKLMIVILIKMHLHLKQSYSTLGKNHSFLIGLKTYQ
jgi:hypothetical protein